MDKFMKTATEINEVLVNNGMKIQKRKGTLFLSDKQGIMVDLDTLFKAIGEKERQDS
jgi:hypothetical protein